MIQLSSKKALKEASAVLAENFMDDPLYNYIFEGKSNKKQALEKFFEAYMAYILPYSDVLADSDEMHLIGVVWFSNRVKSSTVYTLQSLLFAMRLMRLSSLIGIKGALKLVSTIRVMSSTWIDRHVDQSYCHLDLAVIDQASRGKGLFSGYLKAVEASYLSEGQVFTLETQSMENVEKYKHLGFRIVEEIPLPNSELVQYCMIKVIDQK